MKLRKAYEMLKDEKGAFTIQDMAPIAIAFVVVIIVLTVGAVVVTNLNSDQTAGSAAANVSTKGLTALQNIGNQTPLLGTVVVFSVIIGVVVAYFAFSTRGGNM